MASDHKAYVFDHDAFRQELMPLLLDGLVTKDSSALLAFVRRELSSLTDPFEGQPLDSGWEGSFDLANNQICAELALTKYFDPRQDLGWSKGWDALIVALEAAGHDARSIVEGQPLSSGGVMFDPGFEGSYFQSPTQVVSNWELLRPVLAAHPDLSAEWDFGEMYQQAIALGRGLYVTY